MCVCVSEWFIFPPYFVKRVLLDPNHFCGMGQEDEQTHSSFPNYHDQWKHKNISPPLPLHRFRFTFHLITNVTALPGRRPERARFARLPGGRGAAPGREERGAAVPGREERGAAPLCLRGPCRSRPPGGAAGGAQGSGPSRSRGRSRDRRTRVFGHRESARGSGGQHGSTNGLPRSKQIGRTFKKTQNKANNKIKQKNPPKNTSPTPRP